MDLNRLLISSNQNIGLLPSNWISFHQVDVPVKSRSQAYTVIPFALEEQLVQEVDQLHFSLHRDQNQWLVWVCDKAKFSDLLAAQERHPKVIVPDYFALPYENNQPCYLIDGERALVRLDAYHGFSIPVTHFEFALERLSLSIEDLTLIEQPLLALLDSMPTPKVSLLQGAFGDNTSLAQWVTPWASVAASLMIGLTLFLFQQHHANQVLEQQVLEQKQANQSLFRKLFPEEKRIVNIRAQAQQKINRLAKIKALQKTNMIALLDKILPKLKSHKVIRVQQVQYNNYALELELEADSLAQAERLNNQLKQISDLSVEVKKLASTNTGQAITSLVVKRAL